jgi:hypothetical protein
MLEQALKDHINGHVRRLNPVELSSSDVYDILTGEKGTDIARYTKRFLDLMSEAGLLDERGDGVYRQSLLSAVEMKENFDRTLSPLMLEAAAEDSPARAPLASLARDLLTRSEDLDQEGIDQ